MVKRRFSSLPSFKQIEAKQMLDTPLSLIRARYLHELNASYMEHYEEGLVAADSLLTL